MATTIAVVKTSFKESQQWSESAEPVIYVTSFYGGPNGRCIQLTIGQRCIPLRKEDVRRLAMALLMWDTEITSEQLERALLDLGISDAVV